VPKNGKILYPIKSSIYVMICVYNCRLHVKLYNYFIYALCTFLHEHFQDLLKSGLLNNDLDKIVQTTGLDYERVRQIIQDISS